MLAVIKTGGKQYIVSPGQKIKIEKIEAPASAPACDKSPTFAKSSAGKEAMAGKEESQEIIFNEVLLLEKDGKIEIGDPLVKGVKVAGKILKQGKAKKVIVFKIRPKKRYKVKKGHRQSFTEVEILEIRK